MAWASEIFSAFVTDSFAGTALFNIDTDATKAALFGDKTPDQTVTSANSAYGAGVWATGGVSDASGWPAVGRPLVTATMGFSGAVCTFDAVDTVSADTHSTITAAFGCLVYDDTLASPVVDQGICYNSFGGTQSVTEGQFTIVWNGSGIFAITL